MSIRFIAALLIALIAPAALSVDDDKARLFNTFFLEGEHVTWYLVMRQDRTFELIAPDGRKMTSTFVASAKEVYLAGRHFEFKFKNNDVTFEPTKKDNPASAGLAGEMPPRSADEKARFISIQNWQKAGKDPAPPRSSETAPAPPIPAPQPQPAVTNPLPPQPAAGGRATGVAGMFKYSDGAREHSLGLTPGAAASEGTFEYNISGGKRTTGTYYFLDGVLTLDSGFHRRHFNVADAAEGLQFTRRDTDVLKPGDTLGDLPPTERAPLVYKRTGAAPLKEAVRPLDVPERLPVVEPVRDPPVVAEPPPRNDPLVPPPEPGPAPKSLAEMAGDYTYKPNPLVTESFTLKADGTFSYADSNGAKATGTARYEDAKLNLKSGEVEREFTVARDGTALVLTRTGNDNPKITNDLATMSPSVLKSAKYEKK